MSQFRRLRQTLVALPFLWLPAQSVLGDLFYTAFRNTSVSRVDAVTGAVISNLAPTTGYLKGFDDFVGLALGPDGMLYVSARHYDINPNGRWGVYRIDPQSGNSLGPLINTGPLRNIKFGPDGDLYGVYSWSDDLRQYDGVTGALKKTILRGDDFPYPGVTNFEFFADGSIFAVTGVDQVARYDRQTGNRIGPLTDLSDLSDLGLTGTRFEGMARGPDGNLYIAYDFSGREPVLNAGVMRFDGETGSFLDFVMRDVPAQGASSGGTVGLAFGPTGELYVGSQYAEAIFRYDPATGVRLGSLPLTGFVTGASHLVFLNVPEPSSVCLLIGSFVLGLPARRRRW